MKKNILSYVILLFGITIISTGCIKADNTITFDNHDNMKVETTVLFPRELIALYDFNQVIHYSSDKKQIALARISIAEIYTKKKEYRKAMDSAWMAKELYELLGNYEKADECFRYFDYVAELECNRPNGYCY